MWKRIAPLLVVLSVALNMAFISVWAVHAARAHWPTGTADENGTWCPLYRRLDVTDEQWRQIEPRIAEFRARSQTICAEMNRMRAELIDLIASDNPGRDAIAAKQEEIRAGQQRMQQLVVERLLAEKEVLTPEQQKELFELIRQRSACHGPGRMMGLSHAPPSTGNQQDEQQE
ncbi:MAG: Spy/CpxP family protein refolding chaperone [bacterium]